MITISHGGILGQRMKTTSMTTTAYDLKHARDVINIPVTSGALASFIETPWLIPSIPRYVFRAWSSFIKPNRNKKEKKRKVKKVNKYFKSVHVRIETNQVKQRSCRGRGSIRGATQGDVWLRVMFQPSASIRLFSPWFMPCFDDAMIWLVDFSCWVIEFRSYWWIPRINYLKKLICLIILDL